MRITGGLSIVGNMRFGSAVIRGLPTTPGIDLAELNGMPRALWPAVSVSGTEFNSSWTGRTTSPYPTPSGYTFVPLTFIDDWGGGIAINGMNVTYNQTTSPYSTAVFGPPTDVGNKSMYSFTLDTYNGAPYNDAIGFETYVGTNLNTYLGNSTGSSIAVFDTGGVIFQDNQITSPNGPTFEADGVIVDILVNNDSTSPKMWYSVNGSAWIGDFGYVVTPTATWNGIIYEPLPLGVQNQVNISFTNWDASTLYWTIYGGTSADGDFDNMSGTISGPSGSGTVPFYYTATLQGISKTYYVKVGTTAGGNDIADMGPYSTKGAFTIATSDLAYATIAEWTGSSGVTDGFTTDGTWNGRMSFTGDTSLETDWSNFNGMSNGVYSAFWSSGSTVTHGYVYLQNPTATGGYVLLSPCDQGGTTPAGGTWIFPVTLSGTV